jgi:hypothetical protein
MDTAEVVVHEVQRDGVRVVLNLLRERIGQAAGWHFDLCEQSFSVPFSWWKNLRENDPKT